MKIQNNFIPFSNRNGRARFIARHFHTILSDSASVLDVGSSDNDLKKILGDKVYGIDISGSPDRRVDLEKERLSAFLENQFDTVICTEVLEHIDQFHTVTDDIFRVAKRYVIISLPNCPDIWKILRILFTNSTGKFYGLPLERPLDRHRWFFSWKEIDSFFEEYTKKHRHVIREKFVHFNYQPSFKGLLLRTVLKIFPAKKFAQSYWILIKIT